MHKGRRDLGPAIYNQAAERQYLKGVIRNPGVLCSAYNGRKVLY